MEKEKKKWEKPEVESLESPGHGKRCSDRAPQAMVCDPIDPYFNHACQGTKNLALS